MVLEARGAELEGSRCKRDAAENFAEAGAAQRDELLVDGQGCALQVVGDDHEFVGIGAGVTTAAGGRRDGPDGHGAIEVDGAGEVAQAVGGGSPGLARGAVGAGWIAGNGVWCADVEAAGKGVGQFPLAGGGVERPLFESGKGLSGGVGVDIAGASEAVTFIGYVEGVGVREPEAEGEVNGVDGFIGCGGKAFQNAHVARQTLALDIGAGFAIQVEGRGGQLCAGRGQADPVGTGGAGGVDEVDSIDAVTAGALGVVENVVEGGHAAEVVVLAHLVGLVAKLGDGKAGQGRGRAGRLLGLRLIHRADELRAGAEDDACRLGVAAVAGIARSVVDVVAEGVIQDGGASVVAAISVGLSEAEIAEGVYARYGAEERRRHRVGGVERGGGVGVGNVDGVDRGNVAHEGQVLVVGGAVQSELGLGAEAGDELIALVANAALKAVRKFDAANRETKGRELVEEDARGDAEAGVGDDVIKDKRVGPVVSGLRAAVGDAIGGKSFADGDVAGEVVVDAAADDEIAGKKLGPADEILSGEVRGNGECNKRGRRDKARRDAAERKGQNIPPWVVGKAQMHVEAGAQFDAATETNRAV
jgi:hypothetical protein